MKRRFGTVLAFLLVIAIVLSACSSSQDSSNSSPQMRSSDHSASAGSANYDMAMEGAPSGGSGEAAIAPNAPSSSDVDLNQVPMNRMLIYNGDVSMQVKNFQEAQAAIRDLVHVRGGYILEFSDTKTLREEGGRFVIKIPANGFQSFIADLENMDPITLQQSLHGQDVTEEYYDLDARLKAKEVVETRLLSFMEKAETASDLVAFSNELGRVQEEIERIKGRMRYLDQNVAFSTINLRVYQSETSLKAGTSPNDPLWQRAGESLSTSLQGVFDFLAATVVFLAGALPVLILIAIILIPVYYFARNRWKREKLGTDGRESSTDPRE